MVWECFLRASASALIRLIRSGTLDPATEEMAQARPGGCVQKLRMFFQSTSSSALEFKDSIKEFNDTVRLSSTRSAQVLKGYSALFLRAGVKVGVRYLPSCTSA